VAGAAPFVRALQRYRLPLALVTSGEQWKVDAVLAQLGLEGVFAVAVTASDIRVGKPHPECYLRAADVLGVSPAHCIVFEDAISGVRAGAAAGALCIGICGSRSAHALLEAGASYVVPDFSALDLVADGPTFLSLRVAGDSVSIGLEMRGAEQQEA
jgi:sugar-phosphatase